MACLFLLSSLRRSAFSSSAASLLPRLPRAHRRSDVLLLSIARSRLFSGGDGSARSADSSKSIRVVFVDSKGVEMVVMGRAGQNLVALAHENDIALEGACECSLACSTCHVVLEGGVYERLKAPVDEEEDLLDLAFGLTPTSRLGCQVLLQPEMDSMRVTLPSATRNFYVDGHKPKPH